MSNLGDDGNTSEVTDAELEPRGKPNSLETGWYMAKIVDSKYVDNNAGTGKVPTIEIEHPAGEETQWDWVELPEAPWLDGGTAMALVGALSHASRARAGSVSSRSISMYLPWRTPVTPPKPREERALRTAFPCGSSTPFFKVTWTFAFTLPRP